MLYEILDGTVSPGGETVLSHVHFEIKGKEKIGVVGANGAGKTTLLKLIAGEILPDRDDKRQESAIKTSRKITIGMLSQTQAKDAAKTIDDLLMESCPSDDVFSREYYEYRTEYDRIFTGFGFCKEDKKKQLSGFSGGEQTRIALIRLLLMKPDILLLDEPTNHLDLAAVEWLEGYLKSYDRAAVMVSHDRFFLDRTADVIVEVRNKKLYRYPGNYTHFREERVREAAAARKAWESQQKEIERLDQLIEKFKHKPRKAAFARSRKTILDRMEKLPKPEEEDAHIFTEEIEPLIQSNKWPLEAKELQIGYDRALLTLSLRVRKGQKIGIIGENGTGKTTFLKTAAGYLDPLKGECRLGERTTIGYFDQHSAMLESDDLVVDHFHRLFPAMPEKDVRTVLARYLFRGRKAQMKVSSLSGGEKARLVLAEILESRPNLLILDEPTNHMDIQAKETLESAFRAYTGTILFVSHDRYFIQQVADAILVFEEGRAMYYPFGYEHYLSRLGKGEGKELTALIRSEDQAMLEGMRNVPEKEKHRLKEYSTEELTRDWRYRLAKEEADGVSRRYEELLNEAASLKQEELLAFAAGKEGPDTEDLFREIAECEALLTEKLIRMDEERN